MGNSQTKTQKQGRYKKQVHWKAAEHPGPPGKPELVANVEATPDVVTIRWDKPKSDGGSPIIGYLVEHRRTGSPHWVRATPMLISVPEVTLSGLEPGWRYQFRVSAQNTVGMSEPGEVSEPLTVTLQRSIIIAPKFTEELKDSSALENEMAEFIVHVIGQPPPKICWFKDGFEIFSSRRTRIITDNGKSVLTIHQVSLSDEGEIKCTATNRAGHASTKAFVKVDAPPKIRLPRQYEEGLLFELDEIIRLKVSIAGRPQPLVFWSHNGESIQNDERYEVIETDKSSTLKVGVAKRTDRGEYQIRAVNKIGEDLTSFLVTVTDRPRPPGNVKVVMSLGKSVTLSWNEPEDDGGCQIGAYFVEYFRVGWNVWLKAATSRHLTTTLNDLIEGSEYKFRVKAESPYGVSDPSDETDVIFIPDPKRGLMSAPARSRSQPRDIVKDELPVAPKRRSASSTRKENGSNIIIPDTVPTRPKREKIKSPPKTPELSPKTNRKNTGINTNMFDRASLAREISYGIDMKIKKSENKTETQKLEVNTDRSPSPNARTKSPSRFNSLLSSLMPGKKSPTPSKKSPSPSKKLLTPNDKDKNKTNSIKDKPPLDIEIPTTVKMLEISERSDLFDRSPSPIERRMSLKANEGSPEKSKSPSPKSVRDRSPSPSKFSNRSNDEQRRGSIRSNRQTSMDNEEQGSSEFMLVLFPEHGNKYYEDPEGNTFYIEMDDDLIPPPLSLSAPELGAEPPPFEPIRTSVSSTELLYERSLTRFRKAAEAEEAEAVKRAELKKGALNLSAPEPKVKIIEEDDSERRLSIPRIQINFKDQEDLIQLERKANLKRRLSGGASSVTQQSLWAKRRQSLRKEHDIFETTENDTIHKSNLEKNKDMYKKTPSQSNDNYTKQLSPFENVSDKRKEMMLRQRSESEEKEEEEFEKVRKRMEEEKKEIKSGITKVSIMKEESWEEETDSEDERFTYDLIPPLIQAKEEETYHPKTMSMTRSVKDEPFEILSKPSSLPDPNFVPKPILKKAEDNKKPAPDKPVRKIIGNDENSISPLPRDVSPSHAVRSRSPSPSPSRMMQPLVPIQTTEAESQIQQQAAQAARNKRNLTRKDSDEESTVVIDYYGAIVRQYGTLKKGQSQSSDSDDSKTTSKVDETATISALDVLAKYAKNTTEEEDEDDRTVKNILAQYNQETNHKEEIPVEKPKVSRRQPSPSPLMRKPLGTNDAFTTKRQPSPSVARRPMEITPQDAVVKRHPSPSVGRKAMENKTPDTVVKRHPSPNVSRRSIEVCTPESRRPAEISTSERKRKTSRTRSSSRTRKMERRPSTPSDLRVNLEKETPKKSPSPRPITPEQEQMKLEAEIKVRSSIDYMTDLSMFIVACWLYFFKNPLLAIPVLLITVYRQIKDELAKYIPKRMQKKQ